MPSRPNTAPAPVASVEQELSDFAYIVTHDLAASIRHIDGFAELLASDNGNDLTPDQTAYIKLIRDSARRCGGMLEQLRTYSRVQEKPLNPVSCDIEGLFDFARLQSSEAITESGAEIEVGSLARVEADPELLGQALQCLLDNAIKFRRAQTAPFVRIAQSACDDAWRATITDNGIGLPEGEPEKLFGMFYRGRSEGAFPGSGAGLTIARRIFRRHGGDVRFLECENGTRVEISLPCSSN
jgi:chemotaxis family two-component system sensor kinase Cph1